MIRIRPIKPSGVGAWYVLSVWEEDEMELSDSEKLMIISGHAMAIVSIANGGGLPVSQSPKADIRDLLDRMMGLLADPVCDPADPPAA